MLSQFYYTAFVSFPPPFPLGILSTSGCVFNFSPESILFFKEALKDFDGTEINGMGPEIDGNALNALMEKLRMLKEGDTLILAGSIPASMPKSIYSDILKVLGGKGIDFVVDATKELLLNVLQYHPFLIKPNNHELGELFGVKLEKKEQIEPYARKLQELGARNVLVSMAGEGAVLGRCNRSYYAQHQPYFLCHNPWCWRYFASESISAAWSCF